MRVDDLMSLREAETDFEDLVRQYVLARSWLVPGGIYYQETDLSALRRDLAAVCDILRFTQQEIARSRQS
jgi:hypothetical protein